MAVTLTDGYQYLPAAALSVVVLLAGQSLTVGRTRKAAGIKYPQLYAEKAEAEKNPAAFRFNCAQRAHQNTLEYLPAVLLSTGITAVNYPVLAASALTLWSVGRVFFTSGYIRNGPEKRNSSGGALAAVSFLTLFGSAGYTVFKLLV